jgi:uncharacterized caspase-like protein
MRTAVALFLLICAGFVPTPQVHAQTETRIALVIGNGQYRTAPLRNATNDATALADTLKATGFQTTVRVNASRDETVEALRAFVRSGNKSAVKMLFYAGHGLQVKGRNYLIPIDTETLAEEELATKAIDLTEILERLSTERSGINIVVLDACRDNPFSANLARAAADSRRVRTRGLTSSVQGLAAVQAPSGTLVAFSTSPGAVALDGAGANNSVYTKHLVAAMKNRGVSIERVFKQVRVNVALETAQAQIPWETSSLIGEFCFVRNERGGCG